MPDAAKDAFEIFLVASPGLEQGVLAEAVDRGFAGAARVPGGVAFRGTWADVWRANLELRLATRVLARIGEMRVMHLAQLDKRARKFPWRDVLRADVAVQVEATCKRSRIYHGGAAAQRIATALREELGLVISVDAQVRVLARIEDDLCTLSIDTTGDSLHKRGHKEAIGKAPLRETLASHFLRECGYDGTEPVFDPMCGSGTFVIEAAEIAAGLMPGRSRTFAFEQLKDFDKPAWEAMRASGIARDVPFACFGSDRDAGAIAMSKANAARAGVAQIAEFSQAAVSAMARPHGPCGLVIVNPPYGTRIGDKAPLRDLHAALGQNLMRKFKGWRVGLVTSDASLAASTHLPFKSKPSPILHGGLRVYLFQTDVLG
jgi:putative N6-adenine-specific DNA methylase